MEAKGKQCKIVCILCTHQQSNYIPGHTALLSWISGSCATTPKSAPPFAHTNLESAWAPATMYKVSMLPCNYTKRVWSWCALHQNGASIAASSAITSLQTKKHRYWSSEVRIIVKVIQNTVLRQRCWQEMKRNSETKEHKTCPLTLHHVWSKMLANFHSQLFLTSWS